MKKDKWYYVTSNTEIIFIKKKFTTMQNVIVCCENSY